MDFTLIHLIDGLKSTLSVLNGETHYNLSSPLKEQGAFSSSRTRDLAATTINLMEKVKSVLESASVETSSQNQTKAVTHNAVQPTTAKVNTVHHSEAKTNGVLTNGVHEKSLVPSRRFQTEMSFLEPWDLTAKGGEPFFRNQPSEGQEKQNFTFVPHNVYVEDARPNMSQFNIHDNAFAFLEDPNGLTEDAIAALRRNDAETIKKLYYPSVEALIQRITGAQRVIIFDHTVRKKDPKLIGSNPDGQEQPATIVHCDQ